MINISVENAIVIDGYEVIECKVSEDITKWDEEIGKISFKTPEGNIEEFSVWLDDYDTMSGYCCLPTGEDEEDPLNVYPLDYFNIFLQ